MKLEEIPYYKLEDKECPKDFIPVAYMQSTREIKNCLDKFNSSVAWLLVEIRPKLIALAIELQIDISYYWGNATLKGKK